jgi:hypothetical protein
MAARNLLIIPATSFDAFRVAGYTHNHNGGDVAQVASLSYALLSDNRIILVRDQMWETL